MKSNKTKLYNSMFIVHLSFQYASLSMQLCTQV